MSSSSLPNLTPFFTIINRFEPNDVTRTSPYDSTKELHDKTPLSKILKNNFLQLDLRIVLTVTLQFYYSKNTPFCRETKRNALL